MNHSVKLIFINSNADPLIYKLENFFYRYTFTNETRFSVQIRLDELYISEINE